MLKTIGTFAIVVSVGLSTLAMAAVQTVTLDVPGMTCSSYPITVKKALTKVDSVQQVKTSLEKKEAVVMFDDSKTSVAKLSMATADARFPTTLKAAK